MKYGNLSFNFVCVTLQIILCVLRPVVTVEYAGKNINQCILCAYCDPSYRESNKMCTNPNYTEYFKDDVLKFQKSKCYTLGDYEELICDTENTSYVSILPPSASSKPLCYFTINYYTRL